MKRFATPLFIVAVALMVSATAAAQCYYCDQNAQCSSVTVGGSGYVTCVGFQTDCHDGTLGPCAVHCDMVTACSVHNYITVYCECAYNHALICADDNSDGACDDQASFIQMCTSCRPAGEPGASSDGSWTPIVVNLGTGSYKFSGLDDPVLFDFSGAGPTRTAWTARDSAVAFLVVDRGGNGNIADGSYLFGSWGINKVVGDKSKWNGFEMLRLADSNHDGKIDSADAIWPRLKLWTDANHDAKSGPGELMTLDAAGITSLALDYHDTGRKDPNGNMLRFKALLTRNGHAEPYYDVYFLTGR